jgi:hypothetical protein
VKLVVSLTFHQCPKSRCKWLVSLAVNTLKVPESPAFFLQGTIECPLPNKDVSRFDGAFRSGPSDGEEAVPLTIENTLLQSCYLRNTAWACGVAVYTGTQRRTPQPLLGGCIMNFKKWSHASEASAGFWRPAEWVPFPQSAQPSLSFRLTKCFQVLASGSMGALCRQGSVE